MKIIAFLVLLLCSSARSFKNRCLARECGFGRHIDLSRCEVSQDDILSGDLAKCFDSFGRTGVETVWMTGSTFEYLPGGVFDGMSSLTYLRISGKLELISEDAFQGVPNLEILSLASNRLRSFPERIRGLKSLRALYLERNNLTELPCGIFHDLESLEYLTWYGNAPSLNEGRWVSGIPDHFAVWKGMQILSRGTGFVRWAWWMDYSIWFC